MFLHILFTLCVIVGSFCRCNALILALGDSLSFPALVDEGQSCCGDCWCIPDSGESCPARTTAFPQIYPETMVSDFQAKQLYDSEGNLVESGNLFSYEDDCNPFEGVSGKTNWEPYNGCSLSPPQVFEDTNAPGYDEAVCAFKYPYFGQDGDCSKYTYQTYATAEEAKADGAFITHSTQCGVCSNAQDLSVYINLPDLTDPGKSCGIITSQNFTAGVECYMALGFTESCAKVWAYDSAHDRQVCATKCLNIWAPPYGPAPQCALSKCVECDDQKSGPTFNAYSGRTRRNSGIWSGLARSCSSIVNIQQNTCPLINSCIKNMEVCDEQQTCALPNPLQQNKCSDSWWKEAEKNSTCACGGKYQPDCTAKPLLPVNINVNLDANVKVNINVNVEVNRNKNLRN